MLNDPCKPKITILFTAKNYAIIKDNLTEYIWLYSYGTPIGYWDGRQIRKSGKLPLRHSKRSPSILFFKSKIHYHLSASERESKITFFSLFYQIFIIEGKVVCCQFKLNCFGFTSFDMYTLESFKFFHRTHD